MLKIGITGGIGSGKTTVAKIFEVLGIPVYYADDAAKNLMNNDAVLKQQIIEHFGESLYADGSLNRALLSSIVFNQPEKLSLLNSLVHPVTIAHSNQWILEQKTTYVLKEAALLFESEAYKSLDYIIGVDAPYALRLQRTMKRDNSTEDAVKSRISKQMNEEEKMRRSDFIIVNNDKQLLVPQVISLHEKLLSLSKNLV